MRRNIIALVIIVTTSLLSVSVSYAWRGDTWGSISRETILRNATEMVNFSWTPKQNISNWKSPTAGRAPFYAGRIYNGEAYSQVDPQQAYWEFYDSVNNVTCAGSPCLTAYGNDCSGFVSMSWQLPERYNTSQFESDAIRDGGYVTSLGPTYDGLPKRIPGLSFGDALVQRDAYRGHIILFEGYLPDRPGGLSFFVPREKPYGEKKALTV